MSEINKTEKATSIPVIEFTSLHHLDHDNDKILAIDIDNQSEDLALYIVRLIEDIQNRNSKRSFKFDSATTEVHASISLLLKGNHQEAVRINAQRLLRVEKSTQTSMDKLQITIQKGSLFQSVVKGENGTKMIIIGKAEHNDFLDANDFMLHRGLPWKKRIFKSFMAMVDKEGNITDLLVSDTTNALTKYWWSEFLELSELRTDAHNTKFFLECLDKKILDKIKKGYPADHMTLRNSVIGYFRSQTDFDLDTMYELLFEKYSPIDKELPIENIRETVKDLPKKYDLDSQFMIDKAEIKKRSIRKVQLFEGLELVLNGSPNLNNITTMTDAENNKYIRIKTEEGYKVFKK